MRAMWALGAPDTLAGVEPVEEQVRHVLCRPVEDVREEEAAMDEALGVEARESVRELT